MFGWLKKKESPPPLTAVPKGPRVKSYSAASGYVYQYQFAGQRDHAGEIEYVFDVSYDRSTWHRVGVWVTDAATSPWSEQNGRDLRPAERYAIAKIALRNAFDERPPSDVAHQRIAPGAEEVAAILTELDV